MNQLFASKKDAPVRTEAEMSQVSFNETRDAGAAGEPSVAVPTRDNVSVNDALDNQNQYNVSNGLVAGQMESIPETDHLQTLDQDSLKRAQRDDLEVLRPQHMAWLSKNSAGKPVETGNLVQDNTVGYTVDGHLHPQSSVKARVGSKKTLEETASGNDAAHMRDLVQKATDAFHTLENFAAHVREIVQKATDALDTLEHNKDHVLDTLVLFIVQKATDALNTLQYSDTQVRDTIQKAITDALTTIETDEAHVLDTLVLIIVQRATDALNALKNDEVYVRDIVHRATDVLVAIKNDEANVLDIIQNATDVLDTVKNDEANVRDIIQNATDVLDTVKNDTAHVFNIKEKAIEALNKVLDTVKKVEVYVLDIAQSALVHIQDISQKAKDRILSYVCKAKNCILSCVQKAKERVINYETMKRKHTDEEAPANAKKVKLEEDAQVEIEGDVGFYLLEENVDVYLLEADGKVLTSMKRKHQRDEEPLANGKKVKLDEDFEVEIGEDEKGKVE